MKILKKTLKVIKINKGVKRMTYYILVFSCKFKCICEDNHHDHSHHHDEQKKTKKSLSAHEHGLSVLNIVQDMNTISFEFEMQVLM